MMRSFVVALVTFVAVSFAGPLGGRAAAQPGVASPSFPVEIVGGTPGVGIEIFLNNGKVGDTTLNTTGSGDFVLDLANSGKTKVTIYVDVCQDGKIVRVQFVTGDGQAPPEDESCRRRMAAVSFQSDCGVIRITLNFTNWNGRIVGCGFSLQDPKMLGLIGGAALVPVALIAGSGGDSPTAVSVQQPPPPATNTPTTTNTPQPPPPIEFTVTLTGGSWTHPAGSNTSFVCIAISTNPPQPGAQVTFTVQGPFVAPGQNLTATLNARGQAELRATITNVGGYTFTANVNSGGQTRSATSPTINVTFFNNTCPMIQS